VRKILKEIYPDLGFEDLSHFSFALKGESGKALSWPIIDQ